MTPRSMDRLLSLRWIVASGIAAFAVAYFVYAVADADPEGPKPFESNGSDIVSPGTLNQDAVSQARDFSEFPLVWLGEEFDGLRLTKFIRLDRGSQDAVGLVYGDCDPAPGESEPSCVPPVSIIVNRAGTVPGPGDVVEQAAGRLGEVRGVTSRTLSGSPYLWTGTGVVVAVHAGDELAPRVVEALRSANHARLGFSEVLPGERLASLGE